MKLPSLSVAVAALALSTTAVSAPPPSEAVAETQALAEGYAAAFKQLYQSSTLTLVMKRDDRIAVLKDVRKVEAVAGVLVVTIGTTDKFILNPRDVVFLTDAAKYPTLDEPRG